MDINAAKKAGLGLLGAMRFAPDRRNPATAAEVLPSRRSIPKVNRARTKVFLLRKAGARMRGQNCETKATICSRRSILPVRAWQCNRICVRLVRDFVEECLRNVPRTNQQAKLLSARPVGRIPDLLSVGIRKEWAPENGSPGTRSISRWSKSIPLFTPCPICEWWNVGVAARRKTLYSM